jgi:hypothetical protein
MSCHTKNPNLNHCAENPCAVTQSNTAACESLPSQIQNFSDQFFGAVIKTEVDGVVSWSLPCNLDTGLPNNPRASDEGLACYFLRLFDEGIIGLTGPQGASGEAGTDGRNAYTVTLQSFAQPSAASPQTQVLTQFNPAVVSGLYIFIDTAGWYHVDAADSSGVLFLTLSEGVVPEGTIISAGKLVIPAGSPGKSISGPTGPQGPAGVQGPPGDTFSATNGFYFATIGTNYNLQVVYTAVTFVNSLPQVFLPDTGKYLLTAVIDVGGLAGITSADTADFKLRDVSISGDVSGTEHSISNLIDGERKQVVINATYQTNIDATTVGLFAKATSADIFAAIALHTTISFVRLS